MLLLGHHTSPSFGVFIIFFDASSEVHLRSSLPSLHDVIKVPLFNHNVHHRGLWTEAAYGSLKPPPTRRLRRTYLHLSYSMTFTRLHDTSAGTECCRRSDRKADILGWPALPQSGRIPSRNSRVPSAQPSSRAQDRCAVAPRPGAVSNHRTCERRACGTKRTGYRV